MRAGLTLHNGVLEVFDKAENSFIAAYRKYGNDNKFVIQMEYMSRPPMEGKVLILTDLSLLKFITADIYFTAFLQFN